MSRPPSRRLGRRGKMRRRKRRVRVVVIIAVSGLLATMTMMIGLRVVRV